MKLYLRIAPSLSILIDDQTASRSALPSIACYLFRAHRGKRDVAELGLARLLAASRVVSSISSSRAQQQDGVTTGCLHFYCAPLLASIAVTAGGSQDEWDPWASNIVVRR